MFKKVVKDEAVPMEIEWCSSWEQRDGGGKKQDTNNIKNPFKETYLDTTQHKQK